MSSPQPGYQKRAGSEVWSKDDIEALKETRANKVLLFGRYDVSPEFLFRILIFVYAAYFAAHRIADIIYLIQVNCRFPNGLEYIYPSEEDRLKSVSYVRQTIFASMLHQTAAFVMVMMIVCTRTLSAVDDVVQELCSRVWSYFEGCPSWCGCTGCCVSCLNGLFSCCLNFKPKYGLAFRGAVFLALFGTVFLLIAAPFRLWMYDINVNFGFTNVLTSPRDEFINGMVSELIGGFISNIPYFMFYLLVLQHRYGWFAMWAAMVSVSVFAQYHIGTMAPMIFDTSAVFPGTMFGVGRDFPVGGDSHNVSLNRIYYATNVSGLFLTKDKSRGDVELVSENPGKAATWTLRDADPNIDGAYAETIDKVPRSKNGSTGDLVRIDSASWKVPGEEDARQAHIGMRRGKQLREELLGFAEERGIGIGEVYMIDGSSKDTRANAFAAGAGKNRIIGLYDTLFLGENASLPGERSLEKRDDMFNIKHLGGKLRGVDNKEASTNHLWHRSVTRSMTNAEIEAIMGHELGHAAMHHVEQGMAFDAGTSFISFAALGWIVQSPVAAAAFLLTAPLPHIAVFVYNHVLTPPLDGTLKLLSDAFTRRHEYEADAYSARVSEKYATGLQTALGKLTVNSNADPNEPWYYEMLHSDHPTTAKRWSQVARIKRRLYKNGQEGQLKR